MTERSRGLSHSLPGTLRDCTAVWAIGLLASMLAGVAWVHGGILFTEPLLIDEYHTVFLAEKGSLFRSIADLAAGSDFNPPLLFVIERAIGRLTGGITPMSLRVTSFATVWLGMVVAFSALRRLMPPSAAFVGAFSIWSNSVIAGLAFEGRFYGPWLLFCALVILTVSWDAERDTSRRRDIALAVSSVCVCTIHWFGIFSLLLIAIGAAAWTRSSGKSYRRLVPIIAGPIALVICIPIFVGQRAALTEKTWIAPLRPYQVREMLEAYLTAKPILIALLLMAVWIAWTRARRTFSTSGFRAVAFGSLPFTLMLLLPLILTVFSALIQPAMLVRYATPASLAGAAILGLAAVPVALPGRILLLALLFFFSVRTLDARAYEAAIYKSQIDAERERVAPQLDSGRVLMVARRSTLYPLAAATSRPSQLVYPDFTDSIARSRNFSASMIIDRDVARVHHRLYGFPALASIDPRERKSDLYFRIPNNGGSYVLSLLFPDDEVIAIAPGTYRIHPRALSDTKRDPDPLARAMTLLNDNHDAIGALAVLDTLLASDPTHYGALWQRAAALEATGQKARAIEAWRTVISEAQQYGWRDGLREAQRRLNSLLCSDLSSEDRKRISLTLTGSILRWYRCSLLRTG